VGEFGDGCDSRLDAAWQPMPRPVNGLVIEAGYFFSHRCMNQPPVNVAGVKADPIRWLGSGGSELAFGTCCAANCPLRKAK